MSGLDEAEKAARLVMQLDGNTAPGEGRIATDIARAFLAVLPVVRSLLAELDAGADEDGTSTTVTVATLGAIDEMRAALDQMRAVGGGE